MKSSLVAVRRQQISIVCPVTHLLIKQACRGRRCAHPQAFCVTALPSLRVRDSTVADSAVRYRCTLCDDEFTQDEVVVDGYLTAFVSANPTAVGALVRPLANGHWAYRCPPISSMRPLAPEALSRRPDRLSGPQQPARSEARGSCLQRLTTRRTQERTGPPLHGAAVVARAGAERGVTRSHVAASTTRPMGDASMCKAERRAKRRALAARSDLLAAARSELIKRALWESHPESAGDCLW